MKKILVVFLLFFSCQVFAVDWPDDKPRNWWYYEQLREEQRLKVHLKKQINNLGSSKTIEAVVETKPTASKVGGSMMKRVASSAGGKMIGVVAVVELIEAIGWVMDEGSKTYVKKIPEGGDFVCEGKAGPTPLAACQAVVDSENNRFGYTPDHQYHEKIEGQYSQEPQPNGTYSFTFCSSWKLVENTCQFKRLTAYGRYTGEKDVPLTAPLLGAAMLGKGYKDPDPNFNNDQVNTDNWTGVPEAYTPDPSGVGNELADALEDKADRAPKTPDGKAAPIGDPKYQNPLDDNDDANDRQWDGEEGTEGKTENTEKEDPVTGEVTNTGTFQLPKFCDWAMTVCDWYEGWKKTDLKVNRHIDDTKQHQTEEKGFWQSVKDWFDWTKEEPQLEDEPLEIQETEIIDYQHVNYVQFGSSCPFSSQVNSLPMGMLGSLDFETDLSFICDFGVEARPYILGLGHLGALIFLLIGIRNGNG